MLTFASALRELGQEEFTRIAREVRPPANYLWATLLPERSRATYTVDSSSMRIKTTMAGAVGMDSAYPPGGAIEVARFLENTAKFALNVPLPERTLREIQQWALMFRGRESEGNRQLVETALNFYDAVIMQGLLDRDEWIRGQVITTGKFAWTYNGIEFDIDYGLPAGNMLTDRTIGNGDAYHLPGSKFWDDVWEMRRLLRGSARIVGVLHSKTLEQIMANDSHNLLVAGENGATFTLQRYKNLAGNTVNSPDARDRITLTTYDEGGEILDISSGNTGVTKEYPFCAPGKLVFVGSGVNRGFTFSPGSRPDPNNDLEFGYHHLAPTVEGDGQPGRWGRVFTPEERPYALHGEAVENSLPVIENAKRLVVLTTEMPS